MSSTISFDELSAELTDLDPRDRLEMLMELGEKLPEFPEAWKVEPNRVLGCMSQVWLVPQIDPKSPQKLAFRATSDAAIVRGLIALLLSIYNERTPREILDFPIDNVIDSLDLRNLFGMQRSSGLRSMIRRIRDLAEFAERLPRILAVTPAPVDEGPSKPLAEPALRVRKSERHSATNGKPHAVDRRLLLDVDRIRHDFPILSRQLPGGKRLIYLDNGATTQTPRPVLDAMRTVNEQHYGNVHRGGHTLAAETTQHFEEARTEIQKFIRAKERHEIIFTSGTTAGINLVAQSYGGSQLRPGDEILLTEMEHHSNIVPWQQIAARTGAAVRWAPIRDDDLLDVDAFEQLLTPRTRIVALTAISNVLGVINPLRELIARAHAAGGVVLVDAAQAAPHEPLDVQELDCDFLAFSGHKMLGPNGIGVLYGKERLLDAMPPFLGGGSMIHQVTKVGFTPAVLPHKFEAGTPPIVQAIGLKEAIQYLNAIGLGNIMQHERQLTRHAHALLQSIPGLRILGPDPEHKAGIVTFVHDKVHPDDLSRLLDVQGIAVRAGHHCAMPLHERLGVSGSCRASFYLYNSLADVEALGNELARVHKRFAR